jgi:hypothetical protein
MAFHNDEPTLFDSLNRRQTLQRIGQQIAACEPPQVFGIHGDWGAGKTSFLHQLHRYLVGDCPQQPQDARDRARSLGLDVCKEAAHVTVVWFEAWRYQHEEAPIVALLQEIRTQLPWYSKALGEGRKLGEVAVRSALLVFEDLTKKIGVQASKIQDAGERWEKENLATVLPSHMIRQHLEHALDALLGKPKKGAPRPRLVVMVDDLDRCESAAAYKLLEGIKIYLNLPNCVFVLGMNQKVIEAAIAEHIPKTDDAALRALRAREYLDKLCQNIEHLPILRKPADFLLGLLAGVTHADIVCNVIQQYRCLPTNARKIKAYANLLHRYVSRFEANLAAAETKDRTARLIVIFSCLYQYHPDLYRLVEADSKFYLRLLGWAKADRALPDHPSFQGLGRISNPQWTDKGESTVTAEPSWLDAFADPSEGNVLRIQRLISDLGPVTTTEVDTYLVS